MSFSKIIQKKLKDGRILTIFFAIFILVNSRWGRNVFLSNRI